MNKRLFSAALSATLALGLTACPGSDDPLGPQIELTQAQTEDMLDALEAITAVGEQFSVASASIRSFLLNPTVAMYTLSIDETEDCPNGGTQRTQGTETFNEVTYAASDDLTLTFTNCRATSSMGTLWTFNGAPNIKIVMNSAVNLSTGTFTLNGTEKGALDVSSTFGSGSCSIDLAFNFTGGQSSMSGSITGTMCGQAISETYSETY